MENQTEPINEPIEPTVQPIEPIPEPKQPEVIIPEAKQKAEKKRHSSYDIKTSCPDCGKAMTEYNLKWKHSKTCKAKQPATIISQPIIKEEPVLKEEPIIKERIVVPEPVVKIVHEKIPVTDNDVIHYLRKKKEEVHDKKKLIYKRLVSNAF